MMIPFNPDEINAHAKTPQEMADYLEKKSQLFRVLDALFGECRDCTAEDCTDCTSEAH